MLKNKGYGFKADIFSLGSIFYNMAAANFLFPTTNPLALFNMNKMCDLSHVRGNVSHLSPEG